MPIKVSACFYLPIGLISLWSFRILCSVIVTYVVQVCELGSNCETGKNIANVKCLSCRDFLLTLNNRTVDGGHLLFLFLICD